MACINLDFGKFGFESKKVLVPRREGGHDGPHAPRIPLFDIVFQNILTRKMHLQNNRKSTTKYYRGQLLARGLPNYKQQLPWQIQGYGL
jgi:hypothetical protein